MREGIWTEEPPFDGRTSVLDRKRHHCRICGEPAEWRTRIYGQFKNLGEALCDTCEEEQQAFFARMRPPFPTETDLETKDDG